MNARIDLHRWTQAKQISRARHRAPEGDWLDVDTIILLTVVVIGVPLFLAAIGLVVVVSKIAGVW